MGDISIKGRSPLLKGGRVGFKQGGAYGPLRGTTAGGVAKAFRGKAGFKESQALQSKIVKGKANPSRMDQAQRLRANRLRTKIAKRRADREQQKKQAEFQEKYIKPASPETKVKISKQIAPKSWARAGKS